MIGHQIIFFKEAKPHLLVKFEDMEVVRREALLILWYVYF